MALRWLLAALGIGLVIFAGWLVNQPVYCSGPTADILGWSPPAWLGPIGFLVGFAMTTLAVVRLVRSGQLSRSSAVIILLLMLLGANWSIGQAILYTGPPPPSARHCSPHD